MIDGLIQDSFFYFLTRLFGKLVITLKKRTGVLKKCTCKKIKMSILVVKKCDYTL